MVLLDTDDESAARVRSQFQDLLQGITPCPPVELLLATEELEAFYLGDLRALKRVFPDHDQKKAQQYEPDSVVGTWELFGEIVGDGGGRKVAWAKTMGSSVTTRAGSSRSPSFRKMCGALTESTREIPSEKKSKKPRKATVATPRDATGRRRR